MNYKVKITDISSVNQIDGYWTNEDYISLLEELNFPDAEKADEGELKELVQMAISDFEPDEAAEVLLKYKLGTVLKKGQIQNLSHEMMEDEVSEDYADTSLQYDLFNINQLLYESFNGIFPKTKATIIKIELKPLDKTNLEITKEIALKVISKGLQEKNLISRLFEDQLKGAVEFSDAGNVIWELRKDGENEYSIITSDYWIEEEDFIQLEFVSSIKFFEKDQT